MEKPPELFDIYKSKMDAASDLVMQTGSVSEYAKKLENLMLRYDKLTEEAHKNQMVLMEALTEAQTKYKKFERRYRAPWKRRIKNVLISLGFYQPSQEELEEVYRGY